MKTKFNEFLYESKMDEEEILKIYKEWLKNGKRKTDWGLMEWLGDNYILTKIKNEITFKKGDINKSR